MNARAEAAESATREWFIVKPAKAEFLEERAATELAEYAGRILERAPAVVTDARVKRLVAGKTYFPIGSPERNELSRRLVDNGHLKPVRKVPRHPDAFVRVGEDVDGATVVLLAGRHPIGTLYAVYDYLERACGVGFFQDGEYIPQLRQLPVETVPVVEAPRFDNRLHFCWNAHRAIKKYHSFWWTLEEWQREFDWMVKRRMNMLRLDMGYYSRFAGDAFQQAFPEIGPEPGGVLYPRFAGWIVGWGWPPEYRRELTQKILEYGRRLGIRFIYTLSYGTVPFRFRDMHREYTYLLGNQYGESRQLSPYEPNAYDVERKHLAKIIELFGTDHLYMYTPYAEIDVGEGSMERNLRMRIRAGKGILGLIRDVDPDGVWVTDSWDMHAAKRWNAELVKKYLDSFPARDMYLYDTAAEAIPLYRKFGWWHGKKWAFGILHSFAGKDKLHGNPKQLIRRVKEVSVCPTCTGLFMVPESTHHNILFWDLATHLAWQPENVSLDEHLGRFCVGRYGRQYGPALRAAWAKVADAVYEPVGRGMSPHVYGRHPWYHWMEDAPPFGKVKASFARLMARLKKDQAFLGDAMGILLHYRKRQQGNVLYAEDVVVIFRAYAATRFAYETGSAYLAFAAGNRAAVGRHQRRALAILNAITQVLAVCPSYSINKTIAEACKVRGHNTALPEMIRQACVNVGYVNNDVYEQFPGQYIPKTRAYFDVLAKKLAKGDTTITRRDVKAEFERITKDYRDHGWAGPTRKGDAVALVARHMKTLG